MAYTGCLVHGKASHLLWQVGGCFFGSRHLTVEPVIEISFYKSIEGPLRPIIKLQIKGIVTRVDHKPKMIIYTGKKQDDMSYDMCYGFSLTRSFPVFTVDDGTGTIHCVHWLPRQAPSDESASVSLAAPVHVFELGSFVSILGRISHWQNEKQMSVHDIGK